jgi:hypothetical protein
VRRTLFITALVLVAAAVVLLAVGLIEYGSLAKPAIASIWAMIDANSLVGFGAVVEQKIDADLWINVVLPFLTWPAWILPLIVAAILAAIGLAVRSKRAGEVKARPA